MKNSQNKGITLIALAITIIVLLILAGITINLTIGENGIITTAKQAGKNYQEATNTEQNILADFWSGAEETIGSAESAQNSRGVGNAVASDILEGRTAYVNGNVVTGTMKNLSRSTVQASEVTSDEDNVYLSISEAGFYDTDSKISVEKSEVGGTIVSADQIAAGKNVAGITGTYTSDATATAADIASGKTAYVNGSKITGTASTIASMKIVGVPYTVPSKGRICVTCIVSVSNHDNSGEEYIYAYVYKNGSVVGSSKTWVSSWSGGTASCSVTLEVNKGDKISVGGPGSAATETSIYCNVFSSAVYAAY